MLKEKIFVKGHFIDDSNEHKFIYVLSSSSSEKKSTFDKPSALFYSCESLSRGDRSLENVSRKRQQNVLWSSMWQNPPSHVTNCYDWHIFPILIVLSCRTNFQLPVSASLLLSCRTCVVRNPLVTVKTRVAGLSWACNKMYKCMYNKLSHFQHIVRSIT